MGAPRKKKDEEPIGRSRPPISREARQAQLENLALDLIEKRMRDGSASSQETTLFAKSASTRGRVEELRLEAEVALMKAKRSHIESQEHLQELFKEAIEKMGNYRMENPEDDDPDVYPAM